MKSLKQYLTEAEKEYNYKIKFLDECTEEMQEKLEHVLSKYDLKNISAPKKSMFHKNPAGFTEAEAGEVHTIDATTKIPMPLLVRDTIAQHCGCDPKCITVSGDSDPFMEQEPAEYEKGEAKLETPLEDDAEKVDHADYYGEDFKSKVVDEMMKEVKDREQHVSKYMKAEK
tara:strand:+ start:1466 stop:1978 length:513 start_codon:yes stop_codon:yes gene_type:complete